jgi:hypothetical protein
MTRHGRLCWQSIVAAVVVAIGFSGSQPVSGQNYRVLAPSVNEAQAKALSGQVANALRNAAAPDAATQKQLDEYFKGRIYPLMTSTDPAQLGQLAETRKQLFQRYLNAAKSQGARDYLNNLTLKQMGAFAVGPYHPAVRYNAALIMGQLDAQPGVKPLPTGTNGLLILLEGEEFNKVAVPTAVKVAALVGLQRHVRLGVDAPTGERITKAALAVANREELPEDASAKAYGWVRRQAAKVLAAQFAKGLTPPVHDTFVRLVADDKSDLDDRCAVAELLKPEMFSGAQGLDAEAMAQALGGLARNVLAIEAKEAGDYLDEMIGGGIPAPGGFEGGRGGGGYGSEGGGYMGRGGGGYGGGYMSRGGEGGGVDFGSLGLEDQGPKYEKRRMIDRTLAIVAGAQAVAAGASDELKERLTEFSTAILQVAEASAPENATDAEITDWVVGLEKDVNRLVSNWAPARPAADEAIEAEEAEAVEAPEERGAEEAAAPVEAAGGN